MLNCSEPQTHLKWKDISIYPQWRKYHKRSITVCLSLPPGYSHQHLNLMCVRACIHHRVHTDISSYTHLICRETHIYIYIYTYVQPLSPPHPPTYRQSRFLGSKPHSEGAHSSISKELLGMPLGNQSILHYKCCFVFLVKMMTY